MDSNERLEAARAMRRAMLGDAYVDAADRRPRSGRGRVPGLSDLHGVGRVDARAAHSARVTGACWCMAMTAALGRMEEFRLHASSQAGTGVTDDEIDELLLPDRGVLRRAGGHLGATQRGQAVRAEREST